MADNANPQQQGQAQPAATEQQLGEFQSLVQREFRPKTDAVRSAVVAAVQTLAEQALVETTLISDDAIRSIEAIIAQIDRKLTEQVNAVMHNQDFQQLEAAWRGLHYLINNTETDETLKIQFMNVTKKELGKTLKKYKGTAWDQSPLFKKLYEQQYGVFRGEPYGCIIGDYHFDHSAPDVEILGGMAQIAAAAHAPFLAAAAPSLLNMESWRELSNPRDLTSIFGTPDYAPWKSLRESDDAKYLGLTMPRFLARLPYGAKSNPVDDFAYEEDVEGGDHNKFVWANSAYTMATNINKAFKLYGWCTRIRGVESGGIVEGLPVHTFPTDDGGVDMKCPTEIAITDRRESELDKNGLMALVHGTKTDYAAFFGASSLHKAQEYTDPDATANARLGARLPYLFAACRFAHFLKSIVRDKIGSFKERDDMQKWLHNWIIDYVCADPVNASEEDKAKRPLAAAEVEVEEIPGNPGMYSARFYLRPHYQLEGLNVSLRLVSKLPSAKKS